MRYMISDRTVKLCTALELLGPVSTDFAIDAGLCELPTYKASKLLQRLVRDGLLTADRTDKPTFYAVARDWRDQARTQPKVVKARPALVTCVWDLGRTA